MSTRVQSRATRGFVFTVMCGTLACGTRTAPSGPAQAGPRSTTRAPTPGEQTGDAPAPPAATAPPESPERVADAPLPIPPSPPGPPAFVFDRKGSDLVVRSRKDGRTSAPFHRVPCEQLDVELSETRVRFNGRCVIAGDGDPPSLYAFDNALDCQLREEAGPYGHVAVECTESPDADPAPHAHDPVFRYWNDLSPVECDDAILEDPAVRRKAQDVLRKRGCPTILNAADRCLFFTPERSAGTPTTVTLALNIGPVEPDACNVPVIPVQVDVDRLTPSMRTALDSHR